jgi:hypothetical protein
MEVPQKTKNGTTIWSWYTSPGRKQSKSGHNRDSCTPMFIAAQYTIEISQYQPRWPSADERIKKMCYIIHIFIYSCGILFSHKEKCNYVIYRQMNGTGDNHAKWDSQRQKDKYIFSHVQNLDYKKILKDIKAEGGQWGKGKERVIGRWNTY